VLSEEEKAKLISMLPTDKFVNTSEDGFHISSDFLKYNETWRSDLSRVQEDIAEGRNDPEWMRQALDAHIQRQQGDFDSFKDQEYEEFWGMKQKLPHNVRTGYASGVKFETLFRNKVLQVGDVFSYSRNFKGPEGNILIEKEATVSGQIDLIYPKTKIF
jgi:hypothetical protein